MADVYSDRSPPHQVLRPPREAAATFAQTITDPLMTGVVRSLALIVPFVRIRVARAEVLSGGGSRVAVEDENSRNPLERMLNVPVVLDTATQILYLGTLEEVTDDFFVLSNADMHDCRDGHANKEVYLAETRTEGIASNRRQVVVMRSAIISVSRLSDVITE